MAFRISNRFRRGDAYPMRKLVYAEIIANVLAVLGLRGVLGAVGYCVCRPGGSLLFFLIFASPS